MTADEGRCVHEMLPGQCSWCRKLDESLLVSERQLAVRPQRMGPPSLRRITATFEHPCSGCDRRIRYGDPIVQDPESGSWLCAPCGEDL